MTSNTRCDCVLQTVLCLGLEIPTTVGAKESGINSDIIQLTKHPATAGKIMILMS